MPIKQFLCPQCGEFSMILNREQYDRTDAASCPECGTRSPYTIAAPARRNPAYGIQHG